jgi:hypothetical protein
MQRDAALLHFRGRNQLMLMHVSDELKLRESYCVHMVTNKKNALGGKTSTRFCTKSKQLQLPGHAIDCQGHTISLHSGEENLF